MQETCKIVKKILTLLEDSRAGNDVLPSSEKKASFLRFLITSKMHKTSSNLLKAEKFKYHEQSHFTYRHMYSQ